MTDTQSMTTHELVRRTLLDEHGDFLKEAVAMVAAQLMDGEITAQIGAGHGEVSSDRVTHRNGYRSRGWETRVGEIELEIPRKRSGSYWNPSDQTDDPLNGYPRTRGLRRPARTRLRDL